MASYDSALGLWQRAMPALCACDHHGTKLLPPLLLLLLLLQVIDFFLSQKAALDAKPNPSPEDLVATCHALTTVRALLMGGLNRCAWLQRCCCRGYVTLV
jgi:hypothetical protein